MRWRRLMMATVLATSGCGQATETVDTESSSFAGSCPQVLDGTCTDFIGSLFFPAGVEQACPGDFSADPCPDADRMGRCQLSGGTEEEQHWSFYAPDYTAESAEAVCDATEDAVWLGL